MFYDNKLAIIGISSLSLSKSEKYLIQNFKQIYGIILFERNIENKTQLQSLIAEIHKIKPNLNILIDEEGGRVTRLKKIFPEILTSAQKLGDIYHNNPHQGKEAIIQCYSLMAKRLKELKINIVCAPVADLAHYNTHNVIGDRSFSQDKEIVINCCKIAADTLLQHGIIPVIKHIPGHGKSLCDSHHELPVITNNLDDLENNDFAIFKALNNYPLAMTAHIIYEELDKKAPITLSKKALNYIRNKIGYHGKIMTDDINMKALAKYKLNDIVNLSLQAGCDYILHCNGEITEMTEILEILSNYHNAKYNREN